MAGNPTPNWKPGDRITSPVSEMVTLDPALLEVGAVYRLLIGAIVPRPIAFVSTLGPEGIGNLAPFSFFNGVSSNPPCVVISFTPKAGGEKKDTLRNIERSRQFVINMANEWLVAPLNQCSGDYPYGVDELTKVGLTPIPSVRIAPFRVKESAIQLECELYDQLQIGEVGAPGSACLVVGRILLIHVHAPAYRDGKLLLQELRPVSRLGGISYGCVGDVFEIPRPKINPSSNP